MKLYHLSLDIENNIEVFQPDIPSAIRKDEDACHVRVCLSDSIEGCLSAVPWGGSHLNYRLMPNANGEEVLPIKVYEFDIAPCDEKHLLLSPQDLWVNDLVRDAVYTNEYWGIRPMIPTNSYIIELIGWAEESEDLLDYNQHNRLEEGEDYEEVWDGEVITLIRMATYRKITNDWRML